MMSPRTVRIVTALIVVVFVAVTVLSMVPAANAAPLSRSSTQLSVQPSGESSSGPQVVRKAAKRASALTRARAKAERARRDVRKAVTVRARAVAAAVEPARVYQAAVGVQVRAVAAVGETQTALDRANAVLAGEAVLRADITTRLEAATAQFEAAAAAYRTAGEQVTALRTTQTTLVEQLNGAYAQVEAAAGLVADVELVRVPAAAGAVTAAWKAEQKARAARVRVKAAWEDKRKAAGQCRVVTAGKKAGKTGPRSRWECYTGGRWRASTSLTKAAKKVEKAGRAYRKASKVRTAQETYLNGLKGELATRRSELAGVQATAKDLDGQVAVGRAAVSAAEQEASRLRVVADEADKARDAVTAEGQQFAVEVEAARTQQPVLAAALATRTGEAAAAQAQVAATQQAHTAAQAQVDAAQKAAKKAKRVLAKATKRVKALSRR